MRRMFTLALLAAAWGLTLPATAQIGGVTLYEHEDFGGTAQSFSTDVARLAGTVIGNDRVTSLRVAPGCVVTLYGDADFRGPTTTLRADARRLHGTEVGNDSASSLRLACAHAGPHGVALYTDIEFAGREGVFYGDVANLRAAGYDDNAASSVRVPSGCSATLYEHPDYGGRSETFYEDDSVLANNRVGNDAVSSLRVRCEGSGRAGPPAAGHGDEFRCLDRDGSISFRVSVTGRDRGQAALLLAGLEVARYQARRRGDTWELAPTGPTATTVSIDLSGNEISLADRGAHRSLCRWR